MVFMPTSTSGNRISDRLKPKDGSLPSPRCGSEISSGICSSTYLLMKLPNSGPAIIMLGIAAHKPSRIIQPKSACIWEESNIGAGPGSRNAAAAATPANRGITSLTRLVPVWRAIENATLISKTIATSKNNGRAQIKPARPIA
ncbi:hypothetical protein D3C75_723470 [compost metagenome]